MLRRLPEAYYVQNHGALSAEQVRFLLMELRTPSLLTELSSAYPQVCDALKRRRSLLAHAKHWQRPWKRRSVEKGKRTDAIGSFFSSPAQNSEEP